ncbi:GNAT family N-acetyltransferase [Flexivirga caeni]|uniref:GNAT family N-acetyltransferase n=1 Tax=Flexivirga caeni TaxID=2294115 RepID=A0A3M9M5T4_9MICO|nr:GNAT family N-acetyltransferase [Flexivirga caeni]RNI20876.1 GNAT family N-acetyltransferase [Flexivirga caeni]
MSDFSIEPYALEDAAELAALHMQVWRDAYAGMLSQAYLDGMQLEPRIEHWRKRIQFVLDRESQPDAEGAVWCGRLARHLPSGRIAGFISVGGARDDDAPVPQELSSLNVLAQFHGSGVARQLVEATLGERAAYLWVVEQNARAIAFYRKVGFAPDGDTKHDDDLECDELRMVRGARPLTH